MVGCKSTIRVTKKCKSRVMRVSEKSERLIKRQGLDQVEVDKQRKIRNGRNRVGRGLDYWPGASYLADTALGGT